MSRILGFLLIGTGITTTGFSQNKALEEKYQEHFIYHWHNESPMLGLCKIVHGRDLLKQPIKMTWRDPQANHYPEYEKLKGMGGTHLH